MSQPELKRLNIIQRSSEKRLTRKEAAMQLNLSIRQIIRLVKRFQSNGPKSCVSKRRGKRSNRAHPPELKQKIMELVQAHYHDFGPTLASEKLLERQAIKINRETLRQWMMEAKLWKGKKRRSCTVHQQRTRRSRLGELIQIDGSPHHWFEDRGPYCCLIGYIDDATSEVKHLQFYPAETTKAYFNSTRCYLKLHGLPISMYSDKHSIFRINQKEPRKGSTETQFGRAMRELGVDLINANTSQAKGRIEKLFNTMQDRLVKELRLQDISDIETANAFLPKFIEAYNRRFAVTPANSDDAHRQTIPSEDILDLIFTVQSTRRLSKNLELSYKNVIYQIEVPGQGWGLHHAKITVCDDLNGAITLLYKNRRLNYKIVEKRRPVTKIVDSKKLQNHLDEVIRQVGHQPKSNHPWKRYHPGWLQSKSRSEMESRISER